MRPYVSIDIETTGVDTARAQILEIAAVIDDGRTPIEQLPRYEAIIAHKEFMYATPYAMNLNNGLIQRILKGEGISQEEALKGFVMFLNEASSCANRWDEDHGKKPTSRVSLAGKNAAVFDIPIIDEQTSMVSGYLNEMFRACKNHRVIDAGNMFFKYFGYIPTLEEIKKFMKDESPVTHRALDDALDVVKAVRFAYNDKPVVS